MVSDLIILPFINGRTTDHRIADRTTDRRTTVPPKQKTMGCATCGTSTDGKPNGCNSNGGCSSGGCNKLNTFDWLAKLEVNDYEDFDMVEVSFKNGSRKSFYHNPPHSRAIIGDMVVVESASGYDVGRISLTGELVRLQMRKKKASTDAIFPKILRKANERDLEKLQEARSIEQRTMVRSRAIARSLGLEMKLGDVEYQGDKRKATFYYTADGRVDFRELIRHYAKEFKVKIEMRQIGARQESSRIGGLGSCGRELCCSTWLTNFKSVTTGAARYQNLAINQSKLSGQCGRLKCCLNYELDSYLDALQDFPSHHERLQTEAGTAVLIKTDIFKRQMVYTYEAPAKRGSFYTVSVDRVKQIVEMNREGEKPMELMDANLNLQQDDEITLDFEDVTGAVELPMEKRYRRNKRKKHGRKKPDNRRDKRPSRSRDTREKGKESDKSDSTKDYKKTRENRKLTRSRGANDPSREHGNPKKLKDHREPREQGNESGKPNVNPNKKDYKEAKERSDRKYGKGKFKGKFTKSKNSRPPREGNSQREKPTSKDRPDKSKKH